MLEPKPSTMQYVNQPLMRDKLENFIHDYKNQHEGDLSRTT
jgi:hypothetical protein